MKDQDLDGVEAEVIYGILGVGLNLKDPEAMSPGLSHLQRLGGGLLQIEPRAIQGAGLHSQP